MLSFSKVVTLAAAAFGALSQAAPLNQRDAGHSLSVRVSTPTPPAVTPTTLAEVLIGVRLQVGSVVQPLLCLTETNATISAISPVITNLDIVLKDAVVAIQGLVVKPIEDVLIGTDGVVLTVDAAFDLVYSILDVVFEALKVVLELVADVTELLKILPILIETIGTLLQAVCKITGVVFANALVAKLQGVLQAELFVYVLNILGLGPISL